MLASILLRLYRETASSSTSDVSLSKWCTNSIRWSHQALSMTSSLRSFCLWHLPPDVDVYIRADEFNSRLSCLTSSQERRCCFIQCLCYWNSKWINYLIINLKRSMRPINCILSRKHHSQKNKVLNVNWYVIFNNYQALINWRAACI